MKWDSSVRRVMCWGMRKNQAGEEIWGRVRRRRGIGFVKKNGAMRGKKKKRTLGDF